MVLEFANCCSGKPSLSFDFVPSPNSERLAMDRSFRLHEASHRSSFLPSLTTSATQTCAERWLLDVEWQASHMLCCELFRLLNFHVFEGSLKAISIAIVSRSSCIASPKLSVFLTHYSEPRDKVFLTWRQRSTVGRSLLPFNWCPWEPVSLHAQFLTDPSAPWQSALSSLIYSNITIDPPSSCSSLLSVTHWLSP